MLSPWKSLALPSPQTRGAKGWGGAQLARAKECDTREQLGLQKPGEKELQTGHLAGDVYRVSGLLPGSSCCQEFPREEPGFQDKAPSLTRGSQWEGGPCTHPPLGPERQAQGAQSYSPGSVARTEEAAQRQTKTPQRLENAGEVAPGLKALQWPREVNPFNVLLRKASEPDKTAAEHKQLSFIYIKYPGPKTGAQSQPPP